MGFDGYADALGASLKGQTAQVFGEVAYRLGAEGRSLEPYAGIAYISLHQDAFSEGGGPAALRGAAGSTDTAIASLGLRGAAAWRPSQGAAITLSGGLGWRNASGDVTPQQTLAFRSAGGAFTVDGVPIARNALALDADLGVRVGERTRLSLTYAGQIARSVRDHSVKLGLTVGF